jgi:hypothetical protein
MDDLVFVCPQTARAIDSGICTNQESLWKVQDLTLELKCPYCASRHRFSVKSGQLIRAAA